jgi:hypothetical protein
VNFNVNFGVIDTENIGLGMSGDIILQVHDGEMILQDGIPSLASEVNRVENKILFFSWLHRLASPSLYEPLKESYVYECLVVPMIWIIL